MPRFPTGNAAYQERYIEAFRGLTQVLASGGEFVDNEHPYTIRGEKGPVTFLKRWVEMFNTLIAEGAEKDEDDHRD